MGSYNYITYRLKITTWTPLHIGNGKILVEDYDFAVSNDSSVWRFNEAMLLESQKVDDARIAAILAKQKPADILGDPNKYELLEKDMFRYVIPGDPQAEDGKIREFIKDIYDRPYIPGSTIKGALRTALGWNGWSERKIMPAVEQIYQDGNRVKKEKTFAQKEFEGNIFGKKPDTARRGTSNPNYDFMRTLIVSDSAPISFNDLKVFNVKVFRLANGKEKIDKTSSIEVITGRKTLNAELKIDMALFSKWAKDNGLNLVGNEWTGKLVQLCKAYTRQRIEQEISYFQKRNNATSIQSALRFYQDLKEEETRLDEQTFFLQMGWGTGWDAKTFGSRLKVNEDFMAEAIAKFKLGKGHTYLGVQDFPMSRRLLEGLNNSLGKPLGWVLVEMS